GRPETLRSRRDVPTDGPTTIQRKICLRLPGTAACEGDHEDWLLPAYFGGDGGTLHLVVEAADQASAQRAAEPVQKQFLVKDRLPPAVSLHSETSTNGAGTIFLRGEAADGASGLSRLGYSLRILGNGRLSRRVEGQSEAFLPGTDSDHFMIPVAAPGNLRSGEIQVESLWVKDGANPANLTDLLEPPTLCLGGCKDSSAPRVEVLSVVWRRQGGDVTLSPGDGVHPGAEVAVTVQAVDSGSGIDSIRVETPRERAEYRVPEEENSPGLVETTLLLRVPEGQDGDRFDITTMAWDDYGDLPDRNLGEETPFALELLDDQAPTVEVVGFVDAQGNLLDEPPVLGDTVAVRLQGSDPLGKIVGFSLGLIPEGEELPTQNIVMTLPQAEASGTWTTTERFTLSADRRAMADWQIRLTAQDNARAPNTSAVTYYPFLPTDTREPVLDQVTIPETVAPGRSYSVGITAHDVNRVVAQLGLRIQPQQTGLGSDPLHQAVAPHRSPATGQIPLLIPAATREGTFQVNATASDDRGNTVIGAVQGIQLLDDIPPVIDPPSYLESPIQPGIPVTLRVNASDVNSAGISQVAVAWPQGLVNGELVPLIVAEGATSVDNPEVFPLDFRGRVRADLAHGRELRATVTAVDQAAARNERSVDVLRTVDDRGGPSLSAEPLVVVAGQTGTLTLTGLDNSGVRRLGYQVTMPHLDPNLNPTLRQGNQTFGGANLEESAVFQIAVPSTAREAVGNAGLTIELTGEDSVGNLSEGSTTLVIRDESDPHRLSIDSAATATTGTELEVTLSAEDESSGLETLRLRLLPVGLVVDVDCQGTAHCQATRNLAIPEDLTHGDELTLELTATDRASGGGRSAQVTRGVTVVDGSVPELLIQVPAQGHVFVSEQNGTISAQAHDPNSEVTSWAWYLQCGRPGAGTRHAQGGGIIANPGHTVLPSQAFTMPHSGHCTNNGTLTVTATNQAGLTASSTRLVGIQDATAPLVNWRNGQSPATANTGDQDLRFDGQIEDSGSGAERLSLTLPPCVTSSPSQRDYNGQTGQQNGLFQLSFGEGCQPGQHTLTLTARDQAGNSAAVTHRVTVADDDAPSIEFLAPPTEVNVGSTVNLSLRLHDPSSGLNELTLPSVPCGSITGRTWNDNPTNATDHAVEWVIPADCRQLGPQTLTARISDASADSPDGEVELGIEILDTTDPSVSFTTTPNDIRLLASSTVAAEASDASAGLDSLVFSFASGTGSFTPDSQNYPGHPTSGSLQAEVLGSTANLRDGDEVRLRVQATDASGNTSEVTTGLLSVVDDLPPASETITVTASVDNARPLVAGRFPVAAGETITLRVEGTDTNSGITALRFQASWAGGSQSDNEGGLGGQDSEGHDFSFVVPALAHGSQITVTPSADDVSDETGFVDGSPLVLEVDGEGPASTPVLVSPAAANLFGLGRDFRCAITETTTLSGTAAAGVDAVKLTINPLPTGFPLAGRDLTVTGGNWSDAVAGWSTDYQVYTVTLTPIDPVGNEGNNPATISLRSDLLAPTNRSISALNLDGTGRGVYRPQISGLRSTGIGGDTVVQGRLHNCAGASNTVVNDETPANASFQLTQANTLTLTDNALTCSWQVEESFCQRITNSTGSVNLSKVNAPPSADQLQTEGDANDPATIAALRPTLSARYVDSYQLGLNEISFAREFQVRLVGTGCPGGLASSVCWTSALTAVDLDSGDRSPNLQPPLWRPSLANGPTAFSTLRAQSDLLVFEHGSSTLRTLDLAGNTWSTPASLDADGNPQSVNIEAADGLVIDAAGDIVWLDGDGDLRVGTITGSPITEVSWTDGENVANFNPNRCEAIELTTSPSGSDQLIVWCQGKRPILTDVLSVYELDRSVDPPSLSEISYPGLYVPRRLGADFQVIRLPGSAHFRLLRGDGFEQILAAEISTNPTAWADAPDATGASLDLGAGCSLSAEGAGDRYVVVRGGGTLDAWRIDSSNDSETAMNLPAGLGPPEAQGAFLVAGDGDGELLYLSAGANLRPVSHDGSGAWVQPPTVGSEAPLSRDGSYSLQVRFVDEGGDGSAFADAAQAFTVSIP
ncbi:MAG: hypothetical protein CMH55_08640, partial [Myxococcales bacterium]|nr:hypothetical protein [Myxococcales bacterium]